jgi:hypothetical protein
LPLLAAAGPAGVAARKLSCGLQISSQLATTRNIVAADL